MIKLGIDFDNTIVCYDHLFYTVALEQSLIPPNVKSTKQDIRNYLRNQNQEDRWTQLQGYVYGKRLLEASPFPGVLKTISHLHQQKISLTIISHKTLHPYAGPPYNLHTAAEHWLEHHGFYDKKTGIERSHVYFELTKQDKLSRIAQTGCTHFIDDLPEFLAEANFPLGVKKILFAPNGLNDDCFNGEWISSWPDILQQLQAKQS